jgi:hypothetical protein
MVNKISKPELAGKLSFGGEHRKEDYCYPDYKVAVFFSRR